MSGAVDGLVGAKGVEDDLLSVLDNLEHDDEVSGEVARPLSCEILSVPIPQRVGVIVRVLKDPFYQ